MAKYETVMVGDKYAIRRTSRFLFVKTVEFADLATDGHWWTVTSKHFKDCLSSSASDVRKRFSLLTNEMSNSIVAVDLGMETETMVAHYLKMERFAKEDAGMKDLLDKVKTYYHLKY